MKFLEFLERSAASKTGSHVVFISGDDNILKDIIVDECGRLTGLRDVKEQYTVSDVKSVIGLWGEGSLMGPRFLDVRVGSKVKNGHLWKTFITGIRPSENYMFIRLEGDSSGISEILLRGLTSVVECRFPKTTREKARLITSRLKMRGCIVEKEEAKELATRIKTSAEMESSVLTLALLYRSSKKITERDITYVAGEPERFKSSSRALLRGNVVLLAHEINEVEPILLLSIWHSTLKKLYCWMNQQEGKDEKKDSHEEEDDAVEEENRPGVLNISRYLLKDYRAAKQKYSQLLLRQVMEDINRIYQDVRMGRTEDWRERARMVLTKLA
jgi:hypothetical protein